MYLAEISCGDPKRLQTSRKAGIRLPHLTASLPGLSGGFAAAVGDVVTDGVRFVLRIAWRYLFKIPGKPTKN